MSNSSTGNLFDATESMLGYLYQCRYALLLLIKKSHLNPSVEMSIERFDDVAFEDRGTPTELIQTKHHIGQPRNLTDASSDLWKTLRVWSERITNGTIDLADIVLVIVTTATAPDRSIGSLLREQNRNEVEAHQRLVDVAKTSRNQENTAAYTAFLALPPTQQQLLVQAMHVFDEAPDIQDVLPHIKSELAYAAPLQHLDSMLSALEGWWFDTVVCHLKAGTTGIISSQALHTKLDDLREQLRRDALPLNFCFADLPDLPEPAKDQRAFVKQLRVINCNDLTISKAICDHYRSFGQRSQWIREDLLLLEEWQRYEHKLTDEWERRFAGVQEELGSSPTAEFEAQTGRQLYRVVQDQSISIRSDCTEPVIMRGSYHDLADNKKVGWHPRFRELLKEEERA